MLGVCNNRLIANLWRHLKKDIWKKRHINRQNSVKKKELSLKKKMCSSVEEFIASGAVSSITLATDCTMGNDQEEEWGRSKRRGGRGRKKEGKGEKERKREKGRERKKEREREMQVELLARPVIAGALVWTKKKGPDRATYPLRPCRVKNEFSPVPISSMWFTTPMG